MSNDLKIRKLRLRNWKNFADVDVSIEDRVFLVGSNASGKSNFLDVFRFLRDLALAGGGFQEAVRRRGGVSAIRCLAARRHPDIEVSVELTNERAEVEWAYELVFYQDNQRRPLIRQERVLRNGESLADRPNPEDEDDPARLTQTYLEQVNVNKSFRSIAEFFTAIRYLHIVPRLVRDPDRSVGRINDPFGGDFLEQVAKTPERTRNSRLRRIQKALQLAVPQLEERLTCTAMLAVRRIFGESIGTGARKGPGRRKNNSRMGHCDSWGFFGLLWKQGAHCFWKSRSFRFTPRSYVCCLKCLPGFSGEITGRYY